MSTCLCTRWLKERLKSTLGVARYQHCSTTCTTWKPQSELRREQSWLNTCLQSDFNMLAELCQQGASQQYNTTAWRFDTCSQASLEQQAVQQASNVRSSTTMQQPNHIHAKGERRLGPTEPKKRGRAWSQLLPLEAAAAATPGTEAIEANSRTAQSRTIQRHERNGCQRGNRTTLRQTKQDIHMRSGQGQQSGTATRAAQSYPQDYRGKQVEIWRCNNTGSLKKFGRSTWLRTTENRHVTISHKQQSRQRKVHSRKEIPSNNE